MFVGARINVVGTSGSGKTTFARKLASALPAEYVEMDRIFWLPNWTEPTDQVFFQKLEAALETDRWALDGNYTRTIPLKWKNVETVIWMDLSFSRTVYQAFRRAMNRAWTGEEMWPGTGNRETFRKSLFSKSSIIWWTLTSYDKVRARYESLICEPNYSHIRFVRIQNHKQAEKFLKDAEAAR